MQVWDDTREGTGLALETPQLWIILWWSDKEDLDKIRFRHNKENNEIVYSCCERYVWGPGSLLSYSGHHQCRAALEKRGQLHKSPPWTSSWTWGVELCEGATQFYLALPGGTDLEDKSQCLKVISHFTVKKCKDKDVLPVASTLHNSIYHSIYVPATNRPQWAV